jgi:predicted SPOUT superfamily RNA methylase MTH1
MSVFGKSIIGVVFVIKRIICFQFLSRVCHNSKSLVKDPEAERTMNRLSIAIPASVVSDTPHLREKTSKIGLIGRAAAIFRVDEIIIYPDDPRASQKRDAGLIATLLSYMETPQYLRKSLFTLKPELQYAGILPPLRTPHHPLNRRGKELRTGEYREGVTVSETGEGTLVDIGVECPALVRNVKSAIGKRVTVRVVKTGKSAEVELADRDQVHVYWGYSVTAESRTFGDFVRSRPFDLAIATSKQGLPFAQVAGQIAGKWAQASSILVAFGAPSAGLNEIVARQDLCIDDLVDFVVNTIPLQGTETVRTEEALIASLAALNVVSMHRA